MKVNVLDYYPMLVKNLSWDNPFFVTETTGAVKKGKTFLKFQHPVDRLRKVCRLMFL